MLFGKVLRNRCHNRKSSRHHPLIGKYTDHKDVFSFSLPYSCRLSRPVRLSTRRRVNVPPKGRKANTHVFSCYRLTSTVARVCIDAEVIADALDALAVSWVVAEFIKYEVGDGYAVLEPLHLPLG